VIRLLGNIDAPAPGTGVPLLAARGPWSDPVIPTPPKEGNGQGPGPRVRLPNGPGRCLGTVSDLSLVALAQRKEQACPVRTSCPPSSSWSTNELTNSKLKLAFRELKRSFPSGASHRHHLQVLLQGHHVFLAAGVRPSSELTLMRGPGHQD
jgi:hypothetical protein